MVCRLIWPVHYYPDTIDVISLALTPQCSALIPDLPWKLRRVTYDGGVQVL
jgi:hypothetical protein